MSQKNTSELLYEGANEEPISLSVEDDTLDIRKPLIYKGVVGFEKTLVKDLKKLPKKVLKEIKLNLFLSYYNISISKQTKLTKQIQKILDTFYKKHDIILIEKGFIFKGLPYPCFVLDVPLYERKKNDRSRRTNIESEAI
jgi:hypothetical protein